MYDAGCYVYFWLVMTDYLKHGNWRCNLFWYQSTVSFLLNSIYTMLELAYLCGLHVIFWYLILSCQVLTILYLSKMCILCCLLSNFDTILGNFERDSHNIHVIVCILDQMFLLSKLYLIYVQVGNLLDIIYKNSTIKLRYALGEFVINKSLQPS